MGGTESSLCLPLTGLELFTELEQAQRLAWFVTDGVYYASGVTVDTDDHWSSQINRLQQLIDKLECQVSTCDHTFLFIHFFIHLTIYLSVHLSPTFMYYCIIDLISAFICHFL